MLSFRPLGRARQPLSASLSAWRPTTSFRTFKTTIVRAADVVAAPARRPVGAFRGGLFGFLFGSALSGAGMYYYILGEYKVSNELLTEDIFALQAAVSRIESYTKSLEGQVSELQKKRTSL